MVGVNTAILSTSGTFSGVGFALPIATVAKNVGAMIEEGEIEDELDMIYTVLYAIYGPVLRPATPPPPPWYGPGRGTGPGTWHAFTAPSLGYVPSMFAFVPALSRVPCKYHKILHHLQRLRLHQPAFPPIHNHPTHSHRGRGREP